MSYRFSVDPKSRKVGRFLGRVRREIQKAFEEEKKSRGLTQAQIARLLGVDRSVVNRQLMGTENLTLRRVGEFAWVFGRDIEFFMLKKTIPAGANIAYDISTSASDIQEVQAPSSPATTALRTDPNAPVMITRSA